MRLLLCTDLDRTLLPNGTQPESRHARECFNQLVARAEVTLVYVTGRDKTLVKTAINNYQIPIPDYVIADVGSTIYQIADDRWELLNEWDEVISHDWQGHSCSDLHDALTDFRDLRLQPLSKQGKHKLSYFVPLYIEPVSLIDRLYEHFNQQNIQVNIIWSIDEQANIGLLDILPESAGKRSAIEFLMQQLSFTLDETIFSGDSGNDISVMESPIHSVLVANANKDVKQQAQQQAAAHNQLHSLYVAKGDCMGMNGNYSAGILEGIIHFLPEMKAWIGVNDGE